MQYEEDVGTTSWRHTNTGGNPGPHLDAMRKLDLVIRSVSTIGNYGEFQHVLQSCSCKASGGVAHALSLPI